jgi:hypothetical protein
LEDNGNRNWHAVVRDGKECRRILLEAKIHNGLVLEEEQAATSMMVA